MCCLSSHGARQLGAGQITRSFWGDFEVPGRAASSRKKLTASYFERFDRSWLCKANVIRFSATSLTAFLRTPRCESMYLVMVGGFSAVPVLTSALLSVGPVRFSSLLSTLVHGCTSSLRAFDQLRATPYRNSVNLSTPNIERLNGARPFRQLHIGQFLPGNAVKRSTMWVSVVGWVV
jgi:hypothetical protein